MSSVPCSAVQCSEVQYSSLQEAGNGKTMHLLSWSPGSGTWVQEEEIKESVFDLDQVINIPCHPSLDPTCCVNKEMFINYDTLLVL